MKKKIIGIVLSSVGVVLVSALLAAGILLLIRNKNLEETGNVLGIEWYNPEETEFIIDTAEELNELARLSDFYNFEDQTIKLGADIVMNEGSAAEFGKNKPENRWAPISDFSGTFDGQGHTISGLYGKSYEASMALFASTNRSATITDIRLVNSYFETGGSAGAASFVAKGDGKFSKLYSDAIIVNKGDFGGGIIAAVKSAATIEECWFAGNIQQTGRALGGVVGAIMSGRVTMSHCLFSGEIYSSNGLISFNTTDAVATGGLCGVLKDNAGVLIDDSYVSGAIDSNHKTYLASVIGRLDHGSTVAATTTYTTTMIPEKSTILTANGSVSSWPTEMNVRQMTGVKAYQWSRLDFDNYWAAVDNDTPVLKYFAENPLSLDGVEKEYDLSCYKDGSYNFTINNLKELYGFAILSQENSFESTTIKLGADIVVNHGKATDWAQGKNLPEKPWFTIGSQGTAFKGKFDGQMHTISGVYYDSPADYGGIFGHVGLNGQVKNLKVTNTLIEASGDEDTQYVGGVVGMSSGSIDTVYSDAIIKCDGWGVGGIVGQTRYSSTNFKNVLSVNNAWFDGSISGETLRMVGGIIGRATEQLSDYKCITELANCLNTGMISSGLENYEQMKSGLLMGGIVGYVFGTMTINFTDCLNAGEFDVKFDHSIGSFVGRDMGKGVVSFTNCYATDDSYQVNGVPKAHNSFKTANRTGDVIFLPEEILSGINAHKYTVLDFNEYWAAIKNDIPGLKAFTDSSLNTKNVAKMVDVSWYNPKAKEFTIQNLKQLYGLAQLSQTDTFENQTVKLGADIVVNEGKATDWEDGKNLPANPWFTIGTINKAFVGKFDGQMHSISGVYYASIADYAGIFGHVGLNGEVRNLKVANTLIDASGDTDTQYVGGVIGMTNGTSDTLYSDAIIKCDGWGVGGIIGQTRYGDKDFKASLKVNNCWFNGSISGETLRMAGGIIGRATEQLSDYKCITELTNCLNTGIISSGLENYEQMESGLLMGGIVGYVFGTMKINFTDCLNAGEFDVKFDHSIGSFIGRDMGKGVATFKNAYTTRESYQVSNIPVVHNKFKKANLSGVVIVLPEQFAEGKNAYTYTDLDFYQKGKNDSGAWVAVKDACPELKVFSTSGSQLTDFGTTVKSDKKWFESKLVDGKVKEGTVFEIATANDLLTFPLIVDSGVTFQDCTVKLTKTDKLYDINPGWDAATKTAPTGDTAVIWEPIGDAVNQFDGTFDGNGATIQGAYATQTDKECLGFFARGNENSVIKNFVLSNSYFYAGGTNGGMTGSLIGRTRGTINTVKADESVYVEADNVYTGGIVGIIDSTRGTALNKVWFDGKVIATNRFVGGLVASIWDAPDKQPALKNCLYTGELEVSNIHVGGLIGHVWCDVMIEDCLSNGAIYAVSTGNKGSIIGLFGKDYTLEMKRIYTTGGLYRSDKVTTFPENVGDATAESYKGTMWTTLTKEQVEGARAYVNTELDFYCKDKNEDGTWVVVTGCGPEIKALSTASDQITDLSNVIKPSREWFDSKLVDGEAQAGTVFEIATVNDLMALPALVDSGVTFSGCTIKLTKEDKVYDLNPGWNASTKTAPTGDTAVIWEPIGDAANQFGGTFNGNGATIQGVYATQTDKECLGLFARGNENSVIKNFVLSNSYFYAGGTTGGMTGSVIGRTRGTVNTVKADESVYVEADNVYTGGIVGIIDSTKGTALNQVWFDGKVIATNRFVGGIVSSIWDAPDNQPALKNCLYTGELEVSNVHVGGLIGYVWCDAMIEDCLSNGAIYAVSTGNKGSIIGLIGKDCTLEMKRIYTTGGLYRSDKVTTFPENVGDATAESYKGTMWTTLTKEQVEGARAYINTELDFYWKDKNEDGIWVVVTGCGPEIKALSTASDQITDLSNVIKPSREWFDSKLVDGEVVAGTVFEIATANDLMALPALVDSGVTFSGCTIKLTKEDKVYDLNPGWNASTKTAPTGDTAVIWEPIGDAVNQFGGTFDGNGATIQGVYATQTDKECLGLFARGNVNSVIKNFVLSNSYFYAGGTTGGMTGSVIGRTRGTINTVKADESVYVEADNVYTGGIVGIIDSTKGTALNQVWFDGKVIATNRYVGGIVSSIWDAPDNQPALKNCLYTGELEVSNIHVGGLIGHVWCAAMIEDCLSNGAIYAVSTGNKGSIIGLFGKNCTLEMNRIYTTGGLYRSDKVTTFPENVGDATADSYNGTSWNSITANEIKGDAAIDKLQGFSFYSAANPNGVWVTKEDAGPELRLFTETVSVVSDTQTASIFTLVKNFLASIF